MQMKTLIGFVVLSCLFALHMLGLTSVWGSVSPASSLLLHRCECRPSTWPTLPTSTWSPPAPPPDCWTRQRPPDKTHTHTHKGRFIQTHNTKTGIDFVFFNIMKQQIVIALFVRVLPLTPSVRFVKRSVKSEDYHSAHSHIQTRSFSERWTACFVLRHASRIPDVQEQQQFRSTAASWHSAERHCSGRWNLHWAPRKRFETQQLWGRTGDAGNTRRAAFSGQRGTDECEGIEAGERFVWFY